MKTPYRILVSLLSFSAVLCACLALYWLGGNDFVRCRELAEHVALGTLIGACAAVIPWLPQ